MLQSPQRSSALSNASCAQHCKKSSSQPLLPAIDALSCKKLDRRRRLRKTRPVFLLSHRFSSKIWRLTKPEETFEEIGLDLAGRIGAHLLLSQGLKTLRTELLVVPGRSRSYESVATKPGVTARAAFQLRKALPLRTARESISGSADYARPRARRDQQSCSAVCAIHLDPASARACPGKPQAP